MNATLITRRTLRRRGATLVELLAVTLILLMITAMTIPAVAPAMSGRRIREGARMASTFINAARNRALDTGRPTGVWLDRTSGYPEICENMFMAEIPATYSGDFVDSTVETVLVDRNGHAYAPSSDPKIRDFWNLVIPRTRTSYLTDTWSSPDPQDQQLVRVGDQIEFEGSDHRYALYSVELDIVNNPTLSSTKKFWYFATGRNAASVRGRYDNRIHLDGTYVIRWFEGLRENGWYRLNRNTRGEPGKFESLGTRYRIYRQPIRLQAGSIRLPESVVIDLNFSGMSNGLRGNAGTPFYPRVDPKSTNPYHGDGVYPTDNTPVVLVFSGSGQLERIYMHNRESTTTPWSWGVQEAYGPVYLLIGDRAHVTPAVYRVPTTTEEEKETALAQREKNWTNLEALWIRITANTGTVSTAGLDNVTYDPAHANVVYRSLDPGSLLDDARQTKAQQNRMIGGR